jgi:nucleolar pre-ribosomal-associated protein 2
LDQVLQTAYALHNDELKVYLPRKNLVILELLLDRISNNKGTEWRLSWSVWKLMHLTWQNVDNDTRERLFVNHDFIHILAETFDDIYKKGVVSDELIENIMSVVSTLSTNVVWSRPTADNGAFFLTSLFCMCSSLEQSLTTAFDCFRPIISVCINSGLKTKKLVSKAFIPAFSLCISSENLPGEVRRAIDAVFVSFLNLYAGDDKEVTQLIQQGLNIAPNVGSVVQTVEIIFEMVIGDPKLRSKSAGYFNQFVICVPESTYRLLQVASKRNISFPNKQLEGVVKDRLDSHDWKLFAEIAQLDGDVIFGLSDEIFSKLDDKSLDCVEFCQTLVRLYSRSREFPDFFLRWDRLLRENIIWQTPGILEEVSNGLKSLSSDQFDKLFKTLIENINNLHENSGEEPQKKKRKVEESSNVGMLPLITMVKCLLSGPERLLVTATYENLETLLVLEDETKDPRLWELKYLVLSVDHTLVLRYKEQYYDQFKNLKPSKKDHPDLWFHSSQVGFRIAEVTEVEDGIAADYLKYLRKYKDSPIPDLKRIAARWIVLADAKFTDDELETLCDLYLQYTDAFLQLVSQEVFYDQPRVFKHMTDRLIKELEKTPDDAFTLAKAIGYFPPELFTKQMRQSEEKLVNVLCQLEIEKYEKKPNLQLTEKMLIVRRALSNLLKQPTGLSRLETTFEELEELLERRFTHYSQEMDGLSTEISESVLRYHAQHFKSGNKASEGFIKTTVKRLLKLQQGKIIKPKDDAKVMKYLWVLKLSCIVISELLDLVDFEKEGFQESTIAGSSQILEILSKTMDSSDSVEVALLLNHVTEMAEKIKNHDLTPLFNSASTLFEQSIKGLGYDQKTSSELAKQSFLLLCETAGDNDNGMFITSRFIFLSIYENAEDLFKSYTHFLSKLDAEKLKEIYDAVIVECFSETGELGSEYMETLNALFSVVERDSSLDHEAFTKVISMASEKCSRFGEKSLLSFLQLAKLVLREKSWLVSQYGLELVLSIICKINSTQGPHFSPSSDRINEEIYVEMTLAVSSVLLFHRHRINGRHQLVMQVFKSLLRSLTNKTDLKQDRADWLGQHMGPACSQAYARLLSNLCEPNIQSIRERGGKNNLTSSSAQAKKELAKYVHVLLLSYCRFTLNPRFDKDVTESLRPGFYAVFDVLGPEGQRFTSSLMDPSTRDIFRSIYDDYAKNGKWREE